MPDTVLMPVVRAKVLHGGPHTLGLLMARRASARSPARSTSRRGGPWSASGASSRSPSAVFGAAPVAFCLADPLAVACMLPFVGRGSWLAGRSQYDRPDVTEEHLRGRGCCPPWPSSAPRRWKACWRRAGRPDRGVAHHRGRLAPARRAWCRWRSAGWLPRLREQPRCSIDVARGHPRRADAGGGHGGRGISSSDARAAQKGKSIPLSFSLSNFLAAKV